MSHSLNKVILIGNVGKDPEIRSTNTGKEISSFSLATSESWKDRQTGEKKERTEWHRVVVFVDGLVGIIKKYVKKGTRLYLEGELQTRKWVDNSGVEKYTTEVVLQNFNATMLILDAKSSDSQADSNETSGYKTASSAAPAFAHTEDDDNIPF